MRKKEQFQRVNITDHLYLYDPTSPLPSRKKIPYFISSKDLPISCNNNLPSTADVHLSFQFEEVLSASVVDIDKLSLQEKGKIRMLLPSQQNQNTLFFKSLLAVFFPYLELNNTVLTLHKLLYGAKTYFKYLSSRRKYQQETGNTNFNEPSFVLIFIAYLFSFIEDTFLIHIPIMVSLLPPSRSSPSPLPSGSTPFLFLLRKQTGIRGMIIK